MRDQASALQLRVLRSLGLSWANGGVGPLRRHALTGVLLALLAMVASGCANPCGDLQAVCDSCRDPNQKAACERSVDEDSDEVCEQNIESYTTICN